MVVVLVEDDHQRMLVYRYLKRCGLANVTRINASPSGQGSAEQWVRQHFAQEVLAYRARQAKATTALIVVIDADTYEVRDRLRQLDQQLHDDGRDPLTPDEEIARLVPKRNVETWVLCLHNHAVDEETDYKRTRNDWGELIPPAAETLFEWVRSDAEPPASCTSSLRNGIGELKRLTL
jgi:hypothetical protein